MNEFDGVGAAAPPRLLVDTNVWLDYYLAERSGHESALAFLRAALMRGVVLLYPATSITDLFFLTCAQLKAGVRAERGTVEERDALAIRRIAWGCVDNLRELACAVGIDESDLWLASKYRTLTWDLEDNVVLAAAQRAQADFLVTGDRALLSKANVAALTPADMVKVFEAQA